MIFKGTVFFLVLIVVLQSGFSQSTAQQLSLNECLERATARHPLITAAQARMQGAEESRKYVGAKPNPTITVQTENWRSWQRPAFSFDRDVDIFLYGTQRLETAGKAVRRRELADQQARALRSEIDVIRLQLRREVVRTYWVSLHAQTMLETITENRHDLDKLVEYTGLRVREGYAAESELIRARLEQQTLIGQVASMEFGSLFASKNHTLIVHIHSTGE